MIYLASVMGSILSNILLVWKNYSPTHVNAHYNAQWLACIIWQCIHHMIMIGTRLLLLVGWCWPNWSTIQYDRFVCNKGALPPPPSIISPLCVLHVMLTFFFIISCTNILFAFGHHYLVIACTCCFCWHCCCLRKGYWDWCAEPIPWHCYCFAHRLWLVPLFPGM